MPIHRKYLLDPRRSTLTFWPQAAGGYAQRISRQRSAGARTPRWPATWFSAGKLGYSRQRPLDACFSTGHDFTGIEVKFRNNPGEKVTEQRVVVVDGLA